MTNFKFFKLTVNDICNHSFITPLVISKNTSIKKLIDKMNQDQLTGNAYVENEHNQLIGVISLQKILHFFFYQEQELSDVQPMIGNLIFNIHAFLIDDIMDNDPDYVNKNSTLSDVLMMMLNKNQLQLPIVDMDKKVIGEINFSEVISKYLIFSEVHA